MALIHRRADDDAMFLEHRRDDGGGIDAIDREARQSPGLIGLKT